MKKLTLFFFALVLMTGETHVLHAQWVSTKGPPDGLFMTSFAVSGANLYAGDFHGDNGGGVFLTTDYGAHWKSLDDGIDSLGAVFALAVSGTNLYAGIDFGGGVFRSTDNGASWTLTGGGFFAYKVGVTAFAVSGANLFAGTNGFDDSGGVFLTTDSGAHWTPVNTGLTDKSISSLAFVGGDLYAGTGYNGVFRSTDNGAHWMPANNGLPISMNFDALAYIGTSIFAGSMGDGIYRSTDSGASWIPVNNGLTNQYVEAFAVVGANIFAATNDGNAGGGIFLSVNDGASWTPVDSGLTQFGIDALIVSGKYLFAGDDTGIVWRRPLSEMICSTGEIQFDTVLLAHCVTDTICFSNTGDAPDTLQQAFTLGTYKKDYVINNVTYKVLQPGERGSISMSFCPSVADTENASLGLIIGTGDTIYIPISGVGVNPVSVSEPVITSATSISQNYPNPFTQSTTIHVTLSLNDATTANLRIYNIFGEQVGDLSPQFRQSSDITFNSGVLSAGVYYYVLETSAGRMTREMFVVR